MPLTPSLSFLQRTGFPSLSELRENAVGLGAVCLERRRRWRRKHRVLDFLSRSAAMLLLISSIGALGVGWTYHRDAATVDLSQVEDLEDNARVFDHDGSAIGSLGPKSRLLIQREDLPDHFVAAVLAAEDSRFFEHRGFDSRGILRAALANFRHQGIAQGGSTITQQLARNFTDLGGRTFDRKLREIFVAMRLEERYSKDEILEFYLNRIYFGSGFWGVGAASQGYFGKPVSKLSTAESALLCGLIRSPSTLSPFRDSDRANSVTRRVLNRMETDGFLDTPTRREIGEVGLPLAVMDRSIRHRNRYLLEKVRSEARGILGDQTPLEGLSIETSIVPRLHQSISNLISSHLETFERNHPQGTGSGSRDSAPLQAAALVIENRSGRILASVCSRNLEDSRYDRGFLSRRPAGAAFFPLVYAAAYDSGIARPDSVLFDAPMNNRLVMMGGESGILGEWSTETPGTTFQGTVPSAYALLAARNSATARLGFQLGLERLDRFSEKAGIQSPLNPYPSSFIGGSAVTLHELVHAYTVFPNEGWRTDRTGFIDRITDREGRVLYQRPQTDSQVSRIRVINEQSARWLSQLLILSPWLDSSLVSDPEAPHQVGGMPGTSLDHRDHWFVGFDSDHTWGIWIGHDRPRRIANDAFAHQTALPIWKAMGAAIDPRLGTEAPPATPLTSSPRDRTGATSRGHGGPAVQAIPVSGSETLAAAKQAAYGKRDHPVIPDSAPVVGFDPFGERSH